MSVVLDDVGGRSERTEKSGIEFIPENGGGAGVKMSGESASCALGKEGKWQAVEFWAPI
jgi:hypothetical protein